MNKKFLTKAESAVIVILFEIEPNGVCVLKVSASINYFDIMGMAKKSYNIVLSPVCGKWELTRNELDVLLFLWNNPQYDRATDIVNYRGIAKSHVSMSVAHLESRGFLVRKLDEADRRAVHLVLTEQGNGIAQEARKYQTQFFSALYQGVTEDEFALWGKVTEKVCNNIRNLEKRLTDDGFIPCSIPEGSKNDSHNSLNYEV